MVQVGNIGRKPNGGSPPSLFPDAEGRTQFALWSIMKSPLLIGSFIHNITSSPQTLSTVTNAAAIAVNQDALGEQGGYLAQRCIGQYAGDQGAQDGPGTSTPAARTPRARRAATCSAGSTCTNTPAARMCRRPGARDGRGNYQKTVHQRPGPPGPRARRARRAGRQTSCST